MNWKQAERKKQSYLRHGRGERLSKAAGASLSNTAPVQKKKQPTTFSDSGAGVRSSRITRSSLARSGGGWSERHCFFMPWPQSRRLQYDEKKNHKKIVSAREPHHQHTNKPAQSHYILSDFRENAKQK
jgi:hypothetical protein